MKRSKLCLSVIFVSFISFLLISCAPKVEDVKDNIAIKEKNFYTYSYKQENLNINDEIVNEYYKNELGTYTSFLNNKVLNVTSLNFINDSNISYYVDDNNNYYDGYAQQINLFSEINPKSLKQVSSCITYVANDSIFYKQLFGEINQDPQLVELSLTCYTKNQISENYVIKQDDIVKVTNYSTFNANCILKADELSFLKGYTFSMSTIPSTSKISNKEYYLFNDPLKSVKLIYKNKGDGYNKQINVNKIEKENTYNENTHLTINLSNDTVFTYNIKKVSNSSEDYDFIIEDEKFKASDSTNKKVNYFPIDFKRSIDGNSAILLVYKINEDKTLSEENYTIALDHKFKMSKFSEDLSCFKTKSLYKIKNEIYNLDDNHNLLVLNTNFALYKNINESKYYYRNSKLVKELEELENSSLINYCIDNKYYFVQNDYSKNLLNLYSLDINSGNVKLEINETYDLNNFKNNISNLFIKYENGNKQLFYLNKLIKENFKEAQIFSYIYELDNTIIYKDVIVFDNNYHDALVITLESLNN